MSHNPTRLISSSQWCWTLPKHTIGSSSVLLTTVCCFRHRGRLHQCVTLNFGTRVSSFYWVRAAGLLLRLLKRLGRVRHSGLSYGDNLVSILNRLSAALWASAIVVLLTCLKVPMSWRKGSLGPAVVCLDRLVE